MSSLEPSFRRLAGIAALACLLAGCFTPMYADRSLTGNGPSNLREAMRDVEIAKIEGRVGQEIRNDIIFELSGGGGNPSGAPYRLNLQVATNSSSAIISEATGLPQNETVLLDVTYKLQDVANDKVVLTDKAIARVTVDTTQQRYARVRALRDAENRAAKIVSEQIRARVASYFLVRS
ncbi:MAG TPA: LPS assembly lipoprotein LptE [Xanthobacteraceae bacterium]|jgi:LPS-assembly lipoprotein|nr:LPS assembly lipoprotein LptE [Xanthobacteraceae bacterium]